MKKNRVEIEDSFWSSRIRQMCETIIPYQYAVLNDQIPGIPRSHAIENFRIAAGLSEGMYQGMLFQDSDVGKWIEAAAWSLGIRENPEIEEKIDGLTDILKKAQQEDGYLNSYYTCVRPGERLTNIAHGHEMYCAGHLVEAAVAYAQVSGKTELLDIMEGCIEYFMSKIGPEKEKLHIYPGHPELELALYKLYRYTEKNKYLEFMKYLLLERGKQPSFLLEDPGFGEQYHDKWFGLEYHQAHLPVLEQREAKGHAVRAMYLYAGLADLAYEIKDSEITEVLEILWEDVTERKMYVTGAVGVEEHGEAFGVPYDLPNERGYGETCASIGLIFWARRMLKLKLDSQYADVMELALYNGALSGMSLDGMSYFYVNPLMIIPEQAESRYDLRHVRTERVPWFGCACCPPNVARMVSSFGSYAYSENEDTFFIDLYAGGTVKTEKGITLTCETDFPHGGTAKYTIKGEAETTVAIRIPAWSEKSLLTVNGEAVDLNAVTKDGYAYITRAWKDGDTLALTMDMTPHVVYASAKIAADSGKVCVQRGAFVYCAEEVDNGKVLPLYVKAGAEPKALDFEPETLGGIVPVEIAGCAQQDIDTLYSTKAPKFVEKTIRLIPYYTWANRGENQMRVWLPVK